MNFVCKFFVGKCCLCTFTEYDLTLWGDVRSCKSCPSAAETAALYFHQHWLAVAMAFISIPAVCVIYQLLDFGHSDRCVSVCHCSVICISMIACDVEEFLHSDFSSEYVLWSEICPNPWSIFVKVGMLTFYYWPWCILCSFLKSSLLFSLRFIFILCVC